MSPSPTVGQALIDLWQSIFKVLGRPAVQYQLLVGCVALLAAWIIARWIVRRIQRAYVLRKSHERDKLAAEATARLAEPEHSTEAETEYYAGLLADDDILADAATQRLRTARRIVSLVSPVVFPLLAILFLNGVYIFLAAQQSYNGLIAGLIGLYSLLLVYRLVLGVACAFGQEKQVRYYHHWLFGPLLIVTFLLVILNFFVGDLQALANATVLPVEQGWLTLRTIIVATLGYYFWIMTISFVKYLALSAVGGRQNINAGSLDAGLTLLQYGLVALGLIGVFRLLQLNSATIAAVTGGLSIGIGFAMQDVFRNFLGGIIVLFEGSVRPGDWVGIAGTEGEVDRMNIRSTVVRTPADVVYIVPNQQWLNSIVTTFTKSNRRVQASIQIGVKPTVDPHMLQRLLAETAGEVPGVLDEPAPVATLVEFKAARIDFLVVAWLDEVRFKNDVVADLRLRIWDVLAEHNIEAA